MPEPTKSRRGGARPGAGRKPKPDGPLEPLSLRVRPEVKSWLESQAAILNFTVSREAELILEAAWREWRYREDGAPHPLLQDD